MHAWSTSMLLLLHSAFYDQHGEDAAKGEDGGLALNSHGNYIVEQGKSWYCVYEFLWETWWHFIWVFTFCKSTHLGASILQRDNMEQYLIISASKRFVKCESCNHIYIVDISGPSQTQEEVKQDDKGTNLPIPKEVSLSL